MCLYTLFFICSSSSSGSSSSRSSSSSNSNKLFIISRDKYLYVHILLWRLESVIKVVEGFMALGLMVVVLDPVGPYKVLFILLLVQAIEHNLSDLSSLVYRLLMAFCAVEQML